MFLLAYRSSKHETTGPTPSELYFTQDLCLSLDLLHGSPPIWEKEISIGGYIQKLKDKLEKIYKETHQRLDIRSLRTKTRYDQRVRQIHFKDVWFYNPRRVKGKSPKSQSHWEVFIK